MNKVIKILFLSACVATMAVACKKADLKNETENVDSLKQDTVQVDTLKQDSVKLDTVKADTVKK